MTRLPFILLTSLIVPVIWGQDRPRPPDFVIRIRDRNTLCTGTEGDNGKCIDTSDCSRDGINVGPCAQGLLTCCLTDVVQCNGRISKNESVFVNSNYPDFDETSSDCRATIQQPDNVCQLRLDFEEFELTDPDENGECATDSFIVRKTVGRRLPELCGKNKGQHLYVDVGRQTSNPVVLNVISRDNNTPRKWKIKVSFIECESVNRAPPGCVQYYRYPSWVVRSFNYGNKGEGRYLSNQHYTACIRVEENFCSIKWKPNRDGAFSWGDPAIGGANGDECDGDDFVGIDQASEDGSGPGKDRFCGQELSPSGELISYSKPFNLRVWSNSGQPPNVNNSQPGFSLRYTQLPCERDSTH